jgi:hypothetical protein
LEKFLSAASLREWSFQLTSFAHFYAMLMLNFIFISATPSFIIPKKLPRKRERASECFISLVGMGF